MAYTGSGTGHSFRENAGDRTLVVWMEHGVRTLFAVPRGCLLFGIAKE